MRPQPDGARMSLTWRGGPAGIEAKLDDIRLLGRQLARAAGDLQEWAFADRGEVLDGDLTASVLLSPRTCAQAEVAILDATWGPHGLVSRAISLRAQSLACGAVVETYELVDATQRAAHDALAWRIGLSAGVALPLAAVSAVPLLMGAAGVAASRTGRGTAGWPFASDSPMNFVKSHPGLAEAATSTLGGIRAGLRIQPLTLPLVKGAGKLPVSSEVRATVDDLDDSLYGGRRRGELSPEFGARDVTMQSPRSLGAVVGNVGRTGENGPAVFSLQHLTDADGSNSRWIVTLPGTDPGDPHSVRDMTANVALLRHERTPYSDAVKQALERAGVGDDPVLLVGHSQGGMQAAALASDPEFRVKVAGVVTAGAPIGSTPTPEDVPTLSLENARDIVLLGDGARNDASAHHVTVTASVERGGVSANHSIAGVYEALAEQVQRDGHREWRHIEKQVAERGFSFAGEDTHVRTTLYRAQLAGRD